MRISIVLILSGCMVFFNACKSHKLKKSSVLVGAQNKTESPIDSVQKQTSNQNIAKKVFFEIEQTDFEKIKIKSKIEVKSDAFNQTIPANIHVRKDSTIWISVAIGLEVARGNIDTDSMVFLDRLNRRYYKASFEQLSQKFNFDVNYTMLQSLIVGNMPINIDSSDVYYKNLEYNSIEQIRNNITISNKFDLTLNKLYSITAVDKVNQTTLTIIYKEFTKVDGKFVPRIINIEILSNVNGVSKVVKLNIEHSKFDFLDRNIRFPFNIPKNYSEGEIPNF